MLTDDLFRKVLIDPVLSCGADKLCAVSGYATASMVGRHLEFLGSKKRQIELNVVVGMPKKDGIEKVQHVALNRIVSQDALFGSKVHCNYVVRGNPVHAKTYVWLKDSKPILAFAGSANYTLTGFSRRQIEAVDEVDPNLAFEFYKNCLRNANSCDDINIEDMVVITQSRSLNVDPYVKLVDESVTLSFLDSRTNNTHQKSGLNWGQRKGRDYNQAYIPIPMPIARSDFFPDIGEQFTVLTDDGDSFIFVRAQQGGKALHTTENNSQLGEYIRARIKVPSGEFVTRRHLMQYGRTDITFTKIDEETYILDFRPNLNPGEDSEIW